MTRTANTYHPDHETAVRTGRLGGLAGKGKPKTVDPIKAHASAFKAGMANKARLERLKAGIISPIVSPGRTL